MASDASDGSGLILKLNAQVDAPFTEERVVASIKLRLCVTHDKSGAVNVWCDGRPCRFCGITDWSVDWVFGNEVVCWGYPPTKSKSANDNLVRNRGNICFVCMRVYDAEFENSVAVGEMSRSKKITQVAAFAILWGTDITINSKFWEFHGACVAYFVREGKTRLLRVQWDSVRVELSTYKDDHTEERTAPDEIWPYCDYILEPTFRGPPETNGLNHKVVMRKGEKCVLIPAKRKWFVSAVSKEGVTQVTTKMDC